MTSPRQNSSGAWTIPILCLGLALLACAAILPQVEENRRAVWEREKLQLDLAQLDKQVETNTEFLSKLGNDPALAERLAQRQMKMIRTGTSVLEIKGESGKDEMSPFLLVNVPAPAPLAEYKPATGFAGIFLDKKVSTYVMGGGFFLVAIGLILGGSSKDDRPNLSSDAGV